MPYVGNKLRNRYLLLTLIAVSTLFCFSNAFGATYKGFRKLAPEECVPVDGKVMPQLPKEWHRYAGHVKICSLKNDHKISRVSIVSIWVNEYFTQKYTPPEPHKWEDFPLPLIVTTELEPIGTLPEIYPVDDITSPEIYYGNWQSSIPTELRIDVINPAEGGDYYYTPLIYRSESGRYEMKTKEVFDGRRP